MAVKDLTLQLLLKAKDMASATVRRLRGELDQTDDSLNEFDRSSKSVSDSTEDLAHSADNLANSVDNTDNATEDLRHSTDRAERSSKKFGNRLRDNKKDAGALETTIGSLRKKLLGFLTIEAGRRLFMGALSSSRRFQRQMSRVAAVTNASTQEMQALRQAAEHAGETTQYTAEQAGQGLEILARAGFNATQAIELLPQVLAVATAEGTDLATAAGLISDTLAVMNLNVSQGGEVADILAKGSQLANTNMTELGNAISYTGAFARQLNLDLPSTVALLDVLAKNSLRGERGGTGLRSVLAQLSDPTTKAAQAIRRLNLPTDDFIGLIEGLRKAGPDGVAAINAFGIEAGPALRALVASGAQGIEEFRKQLNDVSGDAQKAADIATNDLQGSMDSTASAWDSLRKTFSDPFLKPFTALLGDLVNKFREMKQEGNFRVWGQITADVMIRVAGGVRVVYNLFTLATKSVGVFLTQIAVWVSKAELAITKVMNHLHLASDQAVKEAEIQTGALQAVLDKFAEEGGKDIEDLQSGMEMLSGGWEGYRKAQEEAAQDTQKNAERNSKAFTDSVAQMKEETDDLIAKNDELLQSTEGSITQSAKQTSEQLAATLERATNNLTNTFSNAKKQGNDTAAALNTVFSGISFGDETSVAALSRAMQSLQADGSATADELQKALGTALSKLSSDDLARFRDAGTKAFRDQQLSAEQFTRFMNAELNATLKQTGASSVDVTEKMSAGFKRALAAMSEARHTLAAIPAANREATKSAEVFRQQFEAALAVAKNQDDIRALDSVAQQFFKSGIISARDLQVALDEDKKKAQELKDTLQNGKWGTGSGVDRVNKAAKSATDSTKELTQATDDSTHALDKQADAAEKTTRSARTTLKLAGMSRDEWAAMGDGMADQFTQLARTLDKRNKQAANTGITFADYFQALHKAYGGTQRDAEKVIHQFKSQTNAARGMGDAVEHSAAMAKMLADNAGAIRRQFNKIDDSQLSNLTSAIQAANSASQQLTDNLSQTVASLRDDLDRLKGDEESIQRRNYESRRERLEQQRREAQQSGNGEAMQQANEALGLLAQTHQLNMQQLAQRRTEQQPPEPPAKKTEVTLNFGGHRVRGDFDDDQATQLITHLRDAMDVSQ